MSRAQVGLGERLKPLDRDVGIQGVEHPLHQPEVDGTHDVRTVVHELQERAVAQPDDGQLVAGCDQRDRVGPGGECGPGAS